ncbi:unnamed protein product, partial [Symbiodinium pilosum]
MTIPVKIDMVQIPVRKREHSDLLLGGRHLNQTSLWEDLLDNFWSRYKAYDAGHPMNGAMVTIEGEEVTLHFAMLGVKGDWVYLRKDWFDFSSTAPWRFNESPSPFKQRASPLSQVPGLENPASALVDSAHTWHIGLLACITQVLIWE